MNPQEPFELLNSVHDEESFLSFLAALAADREYSMANERLTPSSPHGPEAKGWENVTLDSYLSAAAAWARASANGLPLAEYHPSTNPWRRCAEILYAGKIYE